MIGNRISREVKAGIHARYADLRDMTEDEMRAAVLLLPAPVQHQLSLGPCWGRWECRVCNAIPDRADRTSPEFLAFAYHEIPKLDFIYDEDAYYTELADETYRRCLATYRAAGWTGEASPPNAMTASPEAREWASERAWLMKHVEVAR